MNYGRVDHERLMVIRVMTWGAFAIYFFPPVFLIMLMVADSKPMSLASIAVCAWGFCCSFLMWFLYRGTLNAYREQRAATELAKLVSVSWGAMKVRTGLEDKHPTPSSSF